MDVVVGSSDQACLSTASWSVKWVAVIKSMGCMGFKLAVIEALICLVFDTNFKYIMLASPLYTAF
jgi:hypothetical protein